MSFGDLKVQDLIYEDSSNNEITVVIADLATKANPTFTGTVTVPTATAGDNSTKAASTAFVVASFAPKAAPAFTGNATGVNLTLSGNLTVNGTTTTIDTTTLQVEDKNIEIGKVSSPSDTTADGGGWSLLGATTKTFNWVNATDAWTSSEHIHLGDNKKLLLGTGGDLEIYHSGSHSNIKDAGTGQLNFWSNTFQFYNAAGNKTSMKIVEDAQVELYYDNSQKLATTSSGVWVTGNYRGGDDVKLSLGSGEDLQIFHNGSHSYLDNYTGTLHIRARGSGEGISLQPKSGEQGIEIHENGGVELYYDNSLKARTTTWGWEVFGNIHGDDNCSLNLGTSNDLQIYHDGTNSFIKDSGTGGLFIQGSGGGAGITLEDPDGNNFIVCIDEGTGGTVELYKGGSKKLETTTGGINVTGAITVNGAALSSAPTFTATASGAITADKPLILNSDATVSQVAESNIAESSGSQTNVPTYSSSTNGDIRCSVWISATKFVQFWTESNNAHGLFGAVGVVTNNTTITYGSRTAIGISGQGALTSVTNASCAYDTSKGVVIISAVNPNASNAGIHWFGCTVTGTNTLNVNSTSLSSTDGNFYGCSTAVDNKGYACTSTIFSNNNWIQYGVTIGTGGAISTKTQNQSGSSGQYGHAYGPRMCVCYNPDKDRFVASAYNQNNSAYHCSVLRLSNGDISSSGGGNAGSTVNIQGSINSGFATISYDTVNKQYFGTFRKSSQLRYKTFTHDSSNIESLDGGSGTAGTFDANEPDDYGFSTFMAKTGKGYLIYRTASNVKHCVVTFSGGAGGSASGAVMTLETPTSYDLSISCNEAGRVLVGFRDGSTPYQGRTQVRQQAVTITNLEANNFIGFASGSYSNGNTATVKINSNTSTQSSLSPLSTYYVQGDGTLGSSPDDPSVVAGVALSSTKLLIKN